MCRNLWDCACVYLAGDSVGTKLSKAEGRLDSPQQSHHIEVLNPPPEYRCHITETLYTTHADQNILILMTNFVS